MKFITMWAPLFAHSGALERSALSPAGGTRAAGGGVRARAGSAGPGEGHPCSAGARKGGGKAQTCCGCLVGPLDLNTCFGSSGFSIEPTTNMYIYIYIYTYSLLAEGLLEQPRKGSQFTGRL